VAEQGKHKSVPRGRHHPVPPRPTPANDNTPPVRQRLMRAAATAALLLATAMVAVKLAG
jgi:hypothetical protein